jgi:Ser/Thr protein kinase RdoA (MazF antagonist)
LSPLHAATKSFKLSTESYTRKHWYEDEEYYLASHAHLLPLDVLQKGRELLSRLLTLPTDKNSYGLVHEDLHQWNFFIHEGTLIPIDFEDCMYDWFAGDFSAGLHNAITAHDYYYRTGQYEYWMGGQKKDPPTFIDYFLRHLLEGYNRENSLDVYWLRQIPDFVRRRHLSTYIDRVQAPSEARPSDEEQMAEFPWRTVSQHAEQVVNDDWADSIFEKFLARL